MQKVNYLVLAKNSHLQTTFGTAGVYAAYLNSLLSLKPGEYACFIESFQVVLNDQTRKTYYPNVYKIFKIEENSRSAFAGEFEIKIY